MGTNQGESSNEWKGVKSATQMAGAENREGNESGVSDTAGRGTSAGESAPFTPPQNEINISASTENRSAKFKNPQVKDDPGQFGEPISN